MKIGFFFGDRYINEQEVKILAISYRDRSIRYFLTLQSGTKRTIIGSTLSQNWHNLNRYAWHKTNRDIQRVHNLIAYMG